MELVPSTVVALAKLDALGNRGLEPALRRMSREVAETAPGCVALSLTLVDEGITLTAAISDVDVLPLDVAQYVDGGPCEESVTRNEVVGVSDVLDEGRWSLYARASAAHGVRSSLSLPILDGSRVVGGVNLYGATVGAFDTHHERLAAIVGAWAPGAVQDADLSFSTRLRADRAPQTLQDKERVRVAIGLIAASQGVEIERATELLEEAATRAGVSQAEVARTVITFHAE